MTKRVITLSITKRLKPDVEAKRKADVYRFIIAYRKKHGVTPSYREMCEQLYLHVGAVKSAIDSLAEDGKITFYRKTSGYRYGIIPVEEDRKDKIYIGLLECACEDWLAGRVGEESYRQAQAYLEGGEIH